jgi:serine/threonine protein kinase
MESGASESAEWDESIPGHDLPTQAVVEADRGPDAIRETVIGHYHLLHRLGQGGMGEVWLGEQQEPVRRHVAIKLIKAGMDTREVVARFQAERQALALMDHPAIAKVFDAGSTPGGRPYFAMEYVAGMPISLYCDHHRLTIRQRMELFVQVCEGVQHAHQKAIIHRDLKPSNILVAEMDGKPMPRIIDFGIAKATSQPQDAETMQTRFGTVVGTLEYMSPEQADSFGQDIDTRSDVYSLGVVLYVLLAGAPPLAFSKRAFDECLRRLREEDPQKPSARVRMDTNESATIARNRNTEAPLLVRQLQGDADSIVLKALEKDRQRRYATPQEFAADIRRYLRNEPVAAHPPDTVYRARKYVRRHRVGVAVAALAMLMLVGFAVTQSMELRRIRRERDRADRVTGFMTNMFNVSNPSESRGNTITAREILDKSSAEIKTGLASEPELQAQLADVMGNVYESLGLYSRARPLIEMSARTRSQVLGGNDPGTLQSEADLGWLLYHDGHDAEGEKLLRDVLGRRRRVLGSSHLDTAQAAGHLAAILDDEGRYPEAEKLEQESVAISRQALGEENPRTLIAWSNLGGTLVKEGRYPEAKAILERTLQSERRVMGPDHPATMSTMSILASCLVLSNEIGPAQAMLRETRDAQRRVLGPDHPDTATTTYNLACLAARQGEHDEALALLREAFEHGLAPNVGLAMKEDSDLATLHGDPRFEALVMEANRRGGVGDASK